MSRGGSGGARLWSDGIDRAELDARSLSFARGRDGRVLAVVPPERYGLAWARACDDGRACIFASDGGASLVAFLDAPALRAAVLDDAAIHPGGAALAAADARTDARADGVFVARAPSGGRPVPPDAAIAYSRWWGGGRTLLADWTLLDEWGARTDVRAAAARALGSRRPVELAAPTGAVPRAPDAPWILPLVAHEIVGPRAVRVGVVLVDFRRGRVPVRARRVDREVARRTRFAALVERDGSPWFLFDGADGARAMAPDGTLEWVARDEFERLAARLDALGAPRYAGVLAR